MYEETHRRWGFRGEAILQHRMHQCGRMLGNERLVWCLPFCGCEQSLNHIVSDLWIRKFQSANEEGNQLQARL